MNTQSNVKQILKRIQWKYMTNHSARQVLPDWAKIINNNHSEWEAARKHAEGGPNILIATSTGGHYAVTPIESMLAIALVLRGANVHFLLCDKFLPACLQSQYYEFWRPDSFVKQGPRHLCDNCFNTGYNFYKSLGLPIHKYSDLVDLEERQQAVTLSQSIPFQEIQHFLMGGLAVGEHALAGALRFFAKGSLEDELHREAVLRRYLEASVLTVFAMRRLLSEYDFESACFHHGIYVPQGLIGEVARQGDVRVVNWNPAYRKNCFIFSHFDTYHHTLMSEPTEVWEHLIWTPTLEAKTLEYLKSRWYGTQDWIKFHTNPQEDLNAIIKELGVDFSKPCIGMLTNVVWDAQLHYPANAFPNMINWVIRTIEYFAERPELQLIIRVHPAEISGVIVSRQPMVREISEKFPKLPDNVFVIPPESHISTYAIMTQCDSVIIYGTKTGVELSSLGMPVIVAGEAWIRNKGLTLDAHSDREYFELLDRLPLNCKLDEQIIRRARMYAYHFFFRRMIPLNCVTQRKGWPNYQLTVSTLNDLLPGRDAGLDVICDGILTGSHFIYPDELLNV